MQIHGEIRPLPRGIAVAAQRRHLNGQEVIVVALAQDAACDTLGQRQGIFDLLCQAMNALFDAPESHGPVTLPIAS